jgi:TPR repeat protein
MYGLASGYAPAQCALGRLLYYGMGVDRSVPDACALFRQAAQQSDARGCYYFGMVSEFGEDTGDFIENYRKSAELSDRLGQCALGIVLARNREFAEAFALFQKAANQNDAGGFFNSGCCFVRGEGTDCDVSQAYDCFRKCRELGGLYWETKPGQRLAYRRSAGLNLIDLSQTFKQQSTNDISAAVNYGWCQYLGAVVPQDISSATRAFKTAAEQRHSGGMLAYAYALSNDAETQNPEATHLFADSALWQTSPLTARSTKLIKTPRPRVSKPQTGKQNFLVPGKRYQGAKEQKERNRQAKRSKL